MEGVEPTHSFEYQILSLARLPIPPHRHPKPVSNLPKLDPRSTVAFAVDRQPVHPAVVGAAGKGTAFGPRSGSAELHSAVSPTCSRLGIGCCRTRRTGGRPADYKSALRQSATLRYEGGDRRQLLDARIGSGRIFKVLNSPQPAGTPPWGVPARGRAGRWNGVRLRSCSSAAAHSRCGWLAIDFA